MKQYCRYCRNAFDYNGEGEKYEVESINSYTKNEKVLYQQAVIRRLHE